MARVITDFFSQVDALNYGKLETVDGKRLFLQNFVKNRFDALVWLLGYRDIGAFHKAEIERIGSVRLIDGEFKSRRLWLWSRGFFKTSLITVAHSIYLIINNVDIRILLVSNTIDISKKMLAEIKSHFTDNQDFRFIFREFCPVSNKDGKIEFGTTENFTIDCRVKKQLKEPTMMVAGVGTNLTGLHFDYEKIDDIVNKDSVSNDTQILASKDYYSSLRHLFDKVACPREDVTGTIYHFNDLYCTVLRRCKLFLESFIPARVNDVPIFPERLNDEALDALIHDPSVGPYAFSTQYMLNPVNPADAKFKEEWFQNYDTLPPGCSSYILVDPASTAKKKSDYTVVERWDIDAVGNAYLVDGVRDKLTVFDRMTAVVDMARRCLRLAGVKYEVLGGRHGDLELLKEYFLKAGLPIVPIETKATTAAKTDRIEQRLVTRFFNKQVFFPVSIIFKSKYDGQTKDFVQDYKLEFLQFPFSEHDDCLDCHSQLYEEHLSLVKGLVVKDAVVEKVRTINEMTADEWEQFYEMQTKRVDPFETDEQKRNRLMAGRVKRILFR